MWEVKEKAVCDKKILLNYFHSSLHWSDLHDLKSLKFYKQDIKKTRLFYYKFLLSHLFQVYFQYELVFTS